MNWNDKKTGSAVLRGLCCGLAVTAVAFATACQSTSSSSRQARASGQDVRTGMMNHGGTVAEVPHDSMVRLEKDMPSEVSVESEFDYEIIVTNISDLMLHDIRVREFKAEDPDLRQRATLARSSAKSDSDEYKRYVAPTNYYFPIPPNEEVETASGTSPRRASEREPRVTVESFEGSFEEYFVGSLAPGESRTIEASTSIGNAGNFMVCSSVTYVPMICAMGKAIDPALSLTKTGPAEAVVGEELHYTLTVKNSGVGPARNVVVTDTLPEGLVASDKMQRRTFAVGTLETGQSRELTVSAKATRPGTFVNRATAKASGGLSDTAQARTVVRQPKLTIEKTGPSEEYTNVGLTYEITVKNTGDAPANNVIIEDSIPTGTSFVSASENGRNNGGKVSWSLGTLQPNQSRTVTLKVEGAQPGQIRNCATARANGVDPVQDCATVRLQGVTGLLIEVKDQNDPIKIGETEIYTIKVTNQGNKAANNVAINIQLDGRTSFISVDGPTSSARREGGVSLRPIASLAPGKSVTWKVTVRGARAGDSRFRVELNADELARPVNEAEATRVFD